MIANVLYTQTEQQAWPTIATLSLASITQCTARARDSMHTCLCCLTTTLMSCTGAAALMIMSLLGSSPQMLGEGAHDCLEGVPSCLRKHDSAVIRFAECRCSLVYSWQGLGDKFLLVGRLRGGDGMQSQALLDHVHGGCEDCLMPAGHILDALKETALCHQIGGSPYTWGQSMSADVTLAAFRTYFAANCQRATQPGSHNTTCSGHSMDAVRLVALSSQKCCLAEQRLTCHAWTSAGPWLAGP